MWRKAITGKRPYRCPSCGWRGWSLDAGPIFTDAERESAERALAPEPPNLPTGDLSPEEHRGDVDIAALSGPIFTDAERETAERVIAPELTNRPASDLRRDERPGDVDIAALDAPSRATTRGDEPTG